MKLHFGLGLALAAGPLFSISTASAPEAWPESLRPLGEDAAQPLATPSFTPRSVESSAPRPDAGLDAQSFRGWKPRSPYELGADLGAPLQPQIRAHLERVVERLAAADVAHLTPELRARRAEHVERLARYAEAAVFPLNDLAPYPAPVFIDRIGTPCAVGHLMIESGARELAERIAARELLAYVPDITTPGTAEWIASSGLTLEECALIQPTYGPCGWWWMPPQSHGCTGNGPSSIGYVPEMVACGDGLAVGGTTTLAVGGLPAPTVAVLLNSPQPGLVQNPFGVAGELCLGGRIGRGDLAIVPLTWWYHEIAVDHTALPRPDGPVAIQPGETWHFQLWYRDVDTSRLTNSVTITYQ